MQIRSIVILITILLSQHMILSDSFAEELTNTIETKKTDIPWLEKKFRGWFYLELHKKAKKSKDKHQNQKDWQKEFDILLQRKEEIIDPHEAKKYLAERKAKLDATRNLMFANPQKLKYILLYYAEEAKLHQDIIDLTESFEKAKYLYPAVFYTLDSQILAKHKKVNQEKQNMQKISKFVEEYDLYVFCKNNIESDQYKYILKYFSKNYSVSIYFIDIDQKDLGKDNLNLGVLIAKKLAIKDCPVTIAISKDYKKILPISQGFRTHQQLLKEILIAIKYKDLINKDQLDRFFEKTKKD